MLLIYWKWKVGYAIAELCEYQGIAYDICDDTSRPISYDPYEYIVPSPWIPEDHDIYATGKIMCELDFAYQFLPDAFQIVSVTGTDGKSTTAWIMYNILAKEFSVNKSVYLSGNFDIPFSETVLSILKNREKEGIIVVEVSSFMSYAIQKYTSDYSIFTNFKPDHLNWHLDLQDYFDAKMRLMQYSTQWVIMNEQVLNFALVNDLVIPELSNVRLFGYGSNTSDTTDGEDIRVSGQKLLELSITPFSGKHNAMNILACALVADEMQIPVERIKEYIKTITGLPHRLELIGELWGIQIVEDSKSTSSQSLEAALGSFWENKNLLLIVWWSDKWDSFDYLTPLFIKRVKLMVAIWTTKDQFIRIAQQWNIPYISTDSLTEWVDWLYRQRQDWDILMLSPGCASFWLFQNYLDRANQFRDAIEKLTD